MKIKEERKLNWTIKEISKGEGLILIFKYHYSNVMPRLTKHVLGGYIDNKLCGVITLGWGTQPKRTIVKLFPELITKDYYEIGKMCLIEELGRNSESQFISKCIKFIKDNYSIKLLYTWSDGIVGKPGYVYQSANFLYGGYIWTDIYITKDGEKIHPRSTKQLLIENQKYSKINKLFWLTSDFLKFKQIKHYKGKQFRYVYPLMKFKMFKKLETTVEWNLNYPKHDSLIWKIQVEKRKYLITKSVPIFNKSACKINAKNINSSLKKISEKNENQIS